MKRISLALLHHPVVDRAGEVVTTALTNLDLHDMSRSARTYGLETMWVVHPVAAQRALAERIRQHWVEGSGKRRIPDRALALALARIVPSLDDVYAAMGGEAGRAGVELWTTAASAELPTATFAEAGARLSARDDARPLLLAFGTGWGLARQIVAEADLRLEPIRARGETGYNHLSVRAACAIALDRLLGAR